MTKLHLHFSQNDEKRFVFNYKLLTVEFSPYLVKLYLKIKYPMLPIFYQIWDASTYSGKIEIMRRIQKGRLSVSDLASLQKINPDIEMDLERDHCADRVYSFSITKSLSEDLIRLFDFFCTQKSLLILESLHIAQEGWEVVNLDTFVNYLTKKGSDPHLFPC